MDYIQRRIFERERFGGEREGRERASGGRERRKKSFDWEASQFFWWIHDVGFGFIFFISEALHDSIRGMIVILGGKGTKLALQLHVQEIRI